VAIERQGGAGREQQGGGAEGRERSVGVGEAEETSMGRGIGFGFPRLCRWSWAGSPYLNAGGNSARMRAALNAAQ
jgi:hypothetical protein